VVPTSTGGAERPIQNALIVACDWPSQIPAPWSVEEQPACFVVRDHNGQALAYVYFEVAGAQQLQSARRVGIVIGASS